jgi:hypothetical protein
MVRTQVIVPGIDVPTGTWCAGAIIMAMQVRTGIG